MYIIQTDISNMHTIFLYIFTSYVNYVIVGMLVLDLLYFSPQRMFLFAMSKPFFNGFNHSLCASQEDWVKLRWTLNAPTKSRPAIICVICCRDWRTTASAVPRPRTCVSAFTALSKSDNFLACKKKKNRRKTGE